MRAVGVGVFAPLTDSASVGWIFTVLLRCRNDGDMNAGVVVAVVLVELLKLDLPKRAF